MIPDHHRPVDRWVAAAAGLAIAAIGLGVAELVAGGGRRLRSPVLGVGDRVVDLVPAPVKELGIALFGTADKVALLVGVGIVLALYAMGVGVIAFRTNRWLGQAGVGLFALVGFVASAAARTGFDAVSGAPSLVGGVAAAAVLDRLVVSARDARPDEPLAVHPMARRRILAGSGATLAAAAILAVTGRRLEARFDASATRETVALPPVARPLPPVGPTAQADGADPFVTPIDAFYRIDTALAVPQVDVGSWELAVTGMVETGTRLSYQDLLDSDLVESDITLTCVSNTVGGDLVGTARWIGVRLDSLLERVGVSDGADQIVGRSVDGYTCGFPVAALDGRDALVAIGMNGEPLPLVHGFPARLIVPGIYGYASATKWLTEIELTTFDAFDHYWVPRGYAARAPIKMQARIDTPRGLDRIPPGPTTIAGVAWAQTIGIDAVEVMIDDSPWRPAVLADEVSVSTWRQWSLPWEATPGRHTIVVRATDRSGAIQTPDRSEPLPDGASGHHTVVVLVDEA